MQFDENIIEEKFNSLPKELQLPLTSPHIVENIKNISTKHSLKLDQEGILFDVVSYSLLGLIPSTNFTKTLSEEAGVTMSEANNIANDINEQILSGIKSSMRTNEEATYSQQAKNIQAQTDIEKVGDFTIEHDVAPEPENVTPTVVESKEEIIDHIEGNQPAVESLTDHLLTTPVTVPPNKVQTPAPSPAPSPVPRGPDPYREPIQ